jgi:hypothetical protein
LLDFINSNPNVAGWVEAIGSILAVAGAIVAAWMALFGIKKQIAHSNDLFLINEAEKRKKSAGALYAEIQSIMLRAPAIYTLIRDDGYIHYRTTTLIKKHFQIFDANPNIIAELPAKTSYSVLDFYYSIKTEIELIDVIAGDSVIELSQSDRMSHLTAWDGIISQGKHCLTEIAELCDQTKHAQAVLSSADRALARSTKDEA